MSRSIFVMEGETTGNSKSPPVSSQTDSKIKSQAPCKLFKVLEPGKKNKKQNNFKKQKTQLASRSAAIILSLSLCLLCTHRRFAELQRQTHLVCLAVRAKRLALFPQGATCHMELMLITRKINKPESRIRKCAINKQVFLSFFSFYLFIFLLETLEQRQPP